MGEDVGKGGVDVTPESNSNGWFVLIMAALVLFGLAYVVYGPHPGASSPTVSSPSVASSSSAG